MGVDRRRKKGVSLLVYEGYVTIISHMHKHIHPHTSLPSHLTLTLTHPHPHTAYQTTFSCRVIDILSEWGSLYVLLKDGRVRGKVVR